MSETVVITRVDKRGAAYRVDGIVIRNGERLKASFCAAAPDVEAMTRQQFEDFAKRNLPHTTEDIREYTMT